jgi:hypothetical protein
LVTAQASSEATFREIFDALVGNVEQILRGKRRAVHLAFV